MKTRTLASLPILIFIGLVVYLLLWGLLYRIPHAAPATVDLRKHSEKPYYVALCSGLASNPHGFPGHNYVVWSETYPINYEKCDSRGFVPANPNDQIPSLWKCVPGALVSNATEGNMRNFDSLIVIVDYDTYMSSRALSQTWKADQFKVGFKDCVAYTHSIATSLKLKAPDPRYRYPQDFIRELKALNAIQRDCDKVCSQRLN